MADVQRTVEILFRGVDELTPTTRAAEQSVASFAGNVQGATQPLANASQAILTAGAAIAGLGAAAIGFATREAATFQSAMLDFQRVASDVSNEDIPRITEQIDQMALQYGISSVEVLQSATTFRQANFSASESFDLVAVAARAVIATGSDMAAVSAVIRDSLSGFGAEAEDAGRLLDILNGVADNTNTTFPELSNGFRDLAPIASLLGLSFEEAAGSLVPIIENGNSGAEAARALRTGFSRLLDPSRAMQTAFDELGVTYRDSNGELLRGLPLLDSVRSSFEGLTDAQRARLAVEVAGADQAARLVPFLESQTRVVEATRLAYAASNSVLAEYNRQITSTEFAVQNAATAFQIAARVVGEQFLGATADSARALTELFGAIRTAVNAGAFDELFAALQPFFTEFETAIRNIARNLPDALGQVDFGPITESLANLRATFGGLFDGIDLSTPQGVAQLLNDLIRIGAGFIDTVSGIVEGLGPFLRSLADGARFLSDFGSSIGTILGYATGISAVAGTVGTLALAINQGAQAAGVLARVPLADTLTTTARAAGSATSALGVTSRLGLWGAVAGLYVGALDLASSFGEDLSESLFNVSDHARDVREALLPVNVAMQDLVQTQTDAALTTDEIVRIYRDLGYVLDPVTNTIQDLGEVYDAQVQDAVAATDANRGYIATTDDGTRSFEQYGQAVVRATEQFRGIQREQQNTQATTERLQERMLELASDERIRLIEARVEIDTAQIEADTQRILGLSEGISAAFSSTGDVIQAALGALGNVGGFYGLEQLDIIQSQLEQENRLRQDAADLQRQLTEATIRQIDAQTRQIEQGGGVITVEAAGLEPALETIWFEIMRAIQVRANAAGERFLLGA